MSIKNWFVRSQRVKDRHNGLIKYGRYLIDHDHPNHKGKTSAIIPIHGNIDNFVKLATVEAVALDLSNAKNKGGRPVQSYAQSFTFVLPPRLKKPTDDQWKNIFDDVIAAMGEKLGLKPDELSNRVFANVHDQENPHLNLLIFRVAKGEALKTLDQKAIITTAKNAFNKSVLDTCGISVSDYEPLQTNLGKRQEKWQLQQAQADNQLIALREATKMANKATENANNAVARANRAAERASSIGKFWGMLNNQILKWINAVQDKDEKQEKRQENRIYKTLESAEILGIPPEQVEIIDELFDNAERKTGKKLERHYKNRI